MSDGRDDMPAPCPLFDAWLQAGLQRLYDQALDEPVPDELLRLLPDPADTACG